MRAIINERTDRGRSTRSYDLEKFGKPYIGFGRQSDSDIKFTNRFVSRLHGCLYKDNGKWYIEDADSRYGLYFHGKKIKRMAVRDGDMFTMVDYSGSVCASIKFEDRKSIKPADGAEYIWKVENGQTGVLSQTGTVGHIKSHVKAENQGKTEILAQTDVPNQTDILAQTDVLDQTDILIQTDIPAQTGILSSDAPGDEQGKVADKESGGATYKKLLLVSGIVVLAVACVVGAICLIMLLNKWQRQDDIESAIEEYQEDVNSLNVKAVFQAAIPDDIAETLFENYDYEELIEYISEELTDGQVSITLDIDDISGAKNTTLREIIDECDEEIKSSDAQTLNFASQIYDLLLDKAGMNVIDSIQFYKVEADVDLQIQADSVSDSMREDMLELQSYTGGSDISLLYVYEYKDDYYIVPDKAAVMMWAYYDIYQRYTDKREKVNEDITNGSTIATALWNAMAVEDAYDSYVNSWGKYIDITSDGMMELSNQGAEAARREIMSGLGGVYSQVQYDNDDGSKCFSFCVGEDGSEIYVYVHDGDDYIEVYPECEEYYDYALGD